MAGLQSDAASLKEVGNGGDGFAAVTALAAHGDDELAEGVVTVGYFERFFHSGK